MSNVSDNSALLTDASITMLHGMVDAKEGIVDVSATMEEMNAAIEETSASVDHVTESVSVMNEAINDMATKAKQGADYTTKINKKAQEIKADAATEQLGAKDKSREMAERAEEAMPVTEPVAVSTQVIDLNTATADELEVLPGIGPSISAEIIAYREEHGVFSSVEDILEVSGIGESKLNSIRDYITVR